MPFVSTADGRQPFCKDRGRGRPVVPTHGWPPDADMCEPDADLLAFLKG